LNLAPPETIDLAQARRVMIARALGNRTKDDLGAEQESARERLLNARAVLGELQRQNAVSDATAWERERTRNERAAQKAAALLSRWQPRTEARAESLQVELDAAAVERARYQIDAQIEQTQRRADDAARLTQEVARREEQARMLAARAREAYEKARAVKPDALAWNPSLEIEDYNAFGKGLRAEFDALGGEAVVQQAREIEGELGRKQGARESRAKNAAVLIARTRELVGTAGQLSDPPTLQEMEELRGKLQTRELEDAETLRAQHRELVGRVHSLRDRQTQLERELGLEDEMLDRAACRAEYAERARESLVRERGVEIVSLARRRIVQKVLPATMDYMRRILPALTRDRYHDAQLDPETYRIQVWDERGGAFKEKNIFSGGTKDQFSLALRLAFALATLPQERGAAPSFIFLDEPLGSFDDERADALIYLLTEGEIARAFDQIFLISHVHVDERLFTHRVMLENGRVAYSDLPQNTEGRV
jgi:exonuclease SbcC